MKHLKNKLFSTGGNCEERYKKRENLNFSKRRKEKNNKLHNNEEI